MNGVVTIMTTSTQGGSRDVVDVSTAPHLPVHQRAVPPSTHSTDSIPTPPKPKKYVRVPARPVPQSGLRAVLWRLLRHPYNWFGWVWLIPSPSMKEKQTLAIKAQNSAKFNRTKVVSFWVDKGGVGKTTQAVIYALLGKSNKPSMPTIVQDCDDGTLANRIVRTTILSLRDAVKNIKHLVTLTDIQRYCSVVSPEGVLFMASTRPNQLTDLDQVTQEDVVELVEREQGHFELVVNDLAPTTHSPTNLGALEVTDALVILTTPAQDCIGKAKKSIAWLNQNGFEELALNATVVVNRAHWWTNVAKIRQEFIDDLGIEFSNIEVFPVNSSWHLMGGRVIRVASLSRKLKAQVNEILGYHATMLADSFVDDDIQLTHLEEMGLSVDDDTSEGGEKNG